MRKTLIILSLLVCVKCFGQEKNAQQKDTSIILKGKFPDFNFLIYSLRHPEMVRPIEDSNVVNWIINNAKMIVDSTQKKNK